MTTVQEENSKVEAVGGGVEVRGAEEERRGGGRVEEERRGGGRVEELAASHTCESLHELAAPCLPLLPPSGTPSLVSSGYGSQAASSSNLSSEDSLSLRSISVDETPEREGEPRCLPPSLLLSPPELSTASASPGEETDHTVTETSSTTVTPSQSTDLAGRLSPDDPAMPRSASERRSLRTSLPAAPAEGESGPVMRSCRRAVPEMTCGMREEREGTAAASPAPDWLQVGESVQLRPSNNCGVVAYVGGTHFAGGTWVGVELDAAQGKHDGEVQGVRYFTCAARRGVMVRPRSVKLDKRGRDVRQRRRSKENSGFELRQNSAGKNKMRQK